MPGQTVGNVHVDQLLSNLAVLYRPLEAGFIADEVCPRLPVKHESDIFPVFTQGDFYATDVDDLVPDRTEPRSIEFGSTTDTYRCQRRELAWDVSDRERQNADDQLRLETNKQQGTLGRLLLKREQRVATLLRKTTNGGKLALGADAATKWDDATNTTYKTVITDVVLGITGIRQAIGMRPNTIVIPAGVVEGLHKTGFFSTLQEYTRGSVDAQPLFEQYPLLPGYLWGMRVLIPGVIKNTAVEGQTASYSDIWDEQVRVLYVSPGPALETPSVAYTMQAEPLSTRTARDDKKRLDWYATGMTIAEKVVATSAGYEINNCLT
jgi:hypothetical protein